MQRRVLVLMLCLSLKNLPRINMFPGLPLKVKLIMAEIKKDKSSRITIWISPNALCLRTLQRIMLRLLNQMLGRITDLNKTTTITSNRQMEIVDSRTNTLIILPLRNQIPMCHMLSGRRWLTNRVKNRIHLAHLQWL